MKLRSMAATAAATTLVITAAVTPAHASTYGGVRNTSSGVSRYIKVWFYNNPPSVMSNVYPAGLRAARVFECVYGACYSPWGHAYPQGVKITLTTTNTLDLHYAGI
jgi:hypothetical protein